MLRRVLFHLAPDHLLDEAFRIRGGHRFGRNVPAIAQHGDGVAQLEDLLHPMGDVNHRDAALFELVEQFEDRLPARGEIPTLLDQFEALARDVDVNVQLDTLPRTTDERKVTIPYNIHARGTFHQIANFINRLERFQRYLKVSDLNIGPEIAGICEASFTLSTFRFIEPKEPTEPTDGNAT